MPSEAPMRPGGRVVESLVGKEITGAGAEKWWRISEKKINSEIRICSIVLKKEEEVINALVSFATVGNTTRLIRQLERKGHAQDLCCGGGE